MRSLAAALLTLYLLRLPLVTCALDFDESAQSSEGGKFVGGPEQRETPAGAALHAFLEHLSHHNSAPCRQHQQNRQLAQYLVDMAKEVAARSNNLPCEHKRNSELINSLLGLPKVMNDAGRK